MKKRHLVKLIVVCSVIVAMLCSCGSNSSEVQTTTKSGSVSTQTTTEEEKETTTDGKVYEATLVVQETADDIRVAKALEAEVRRLYNASNGRLKITVSANSAAVASASDIFDSVKSGLVEMGMQSSSRVSGYFPLTDIVTLPGNIGYPGGTDMGMVACALYEQVPEIQAEFEGVKVLSFNSTAATMLFSVNDILNKPSDLTGKLIRGGGTYGLEAIEAVGASAVTLSPGEWADGAVKGVYDINVSNFASNVTFAMTDIFNYCYNYTIQTSYFIYVVNEDFYNSLPADLQALLSWDNFGYESAGLYGGVVNAAEEEYSQIFYDNGGKMIEPSEADKAELDGMLATVTDSWLETATGLVGETRAQEILDLFHSLCEQYAEYEYDYQAVLDRDLALPAVE